MAEPLKKRTDFPMTGAGSREWRAYQKEHGLGAYAGGGQVKAELEPAEETVHQGRRAVGGGAKPVQRTDETAGQFHLRMARWNQARAEGQRRALRKKRK